MNGLFERYARQIALPEIGVEGQRLLSQARVLIVGVGGLGSPVAMYLAAAGVGRLGLVDDDVVSLSNLQRQLLYDESQIGFSKVECAAKALAKLNSDVVVERYPYRLTADNAQEIVSHYDYVIDGCDNYATRYIIDEVCSDLRIPYIYGAIGEFSGQVAVFDYKGGVSYRMLYPDVECFCSLNTGGMPVVGTTPAVVGVIQANQLLQLVCRFGSPLVNELLTIDLLKMRFDRILL